MAAVNRAESQDNALLRATTSNREERAPSSNLNPTAVSLDTSEKTPNTGHGASLAAATQEMELFSASNTKKDGDIHARQNTASAPEIHLDGQPKIPLTIRVASMEVGVRKLLDKFGLVYVQSQEKAPHASVQINKSKIGSTGHFIVQRSATAKKLTLRILQ